ncbi:MAG: DUF916 domain-containing protein [Parcubacteria group bacterium]|jgi:hypothetical protein
MRKIWQAGRIAALGLIVLVSLFFPVSFSHAEGPVSLTVSPLYFDLEINPGEEKTGKIYVGNNSDQNLDIAVEFSDFFMDDAGKYIFTGGRDIANDELRPYLMSKWLSVDEDNFSLEKGKNKVVDYKIRAPEDANLGGHYGVIFFRTRCNIEEDKNVVWTDKSSVCVSGRAGVLFLVQAGGNAVKKGILKKVELPRISFTDKSNLEIEIANEGNSHFKPEGEVSVKNIFGREIGRLEIKDRTILPTTSRVFSEDIQRKDFLGLYKISGNIKDGEGRNMKFQKFIFLVPWKELLAVLALAGIWWWFLRRYKISLRSGASK